MSQFKQLVYKVLQENGIDLKEWDDEYYGDPDDHTGDDEIEWTLDLPMNDEIRQIILQNNILPEEDLKDDMGNWEPVEELDVVIEYEIEGYPDDESINVDKIYLENYDINKNQKVRCADITNLLPAEYLDQVAKQLENSGKIELHSYDYEGQVRDDYYSGIAPGGKL